MFQAYRYVGRNNKTNEYIYEITDDDFICEIRIPCVSQIEFGAEPPCVIVQEYKRRGLNVAKNLALCILWYANKYNHTIEHIKNWQDEQCPNYIPEWNTYIKDRDDYLNTLLLFS